MENLFRQVINPLQYMKLRQHVKNLFNILNLVIK